MSDCADLPKAHVPNGPDWVLAQLWSRWTSDLSTDHRLMDLGDAELGDLGIT
jgi:hypothetical protein